MHDGEVLELSVVLPCLNESLTLSTCIEKAITCLNELGVAHEIIVADNGSTDGSQEIARNAGARVIDVPRRGYGAALRGGIAAARGRYVLMADSDDSYALDDLGPFMSALRGGTDLVMGNRFAGGIAPGAMPPLHRYLGNPVLSWIGRLFFRIPIRDFHCGIRAFDRQKAVDLKLKSDGMEFASELVVKFALSRARVSEVPTTLRPDGRNRPPHLRSWRDGWRHLRFLLLFSPRWLFLYPGVALAVLGLLLMAKLSFGPLVLGDAHLDSQSLLFSGAAVIIGVQAVLFAVLGRAYATRRGILPETRLLRAAEHPFALERGVIAGCLFLLAGLVGSTISVANWATSGFGELDLAQALRTAVPSITFLSLGAELLMASFFLGLLQLDEHITPLTTDAAQQQSADNSIRVDSHDLA